jgi:hypothetical protein
MLDRKLFEEAVAKIPSPGSSVITTLDAIHADTNDMTANARRAKIIQAVLDCWCQHCGREMSEHGLRCYPEMEVDG